MYTPTDKIILTIGFTLLAIFLVLYFLPSIVAFFRKANHRIVILVLNLLLGWSFIGWIAFLIWGIVDHSDRDEIRS